MSSPSAPSPARPSWSPPPPTSATISRVPYLRGIDGLRAVALIAVVLFNANPRWVPGGFLGIEVGFVLSGYLVTLAMLNGRERDGRIGIVRTWWRRVRRIGPALWVMIALVAGYVALWMPAVRRRQRWAALNGAVFGSNWYELWHQHVQVLTDSFQPFQHLWPLAVQQQWLLVWVPLLALATRRGRDRLPWLGSALLLVAAAIAAFVGWRFVSGPVPVRCTSPLPRGYTEVAGHCWNINEHFYLSTWARLPGLLLGSVMAVWWRPLAVMRGGMRRHGRLVDLAALAGLAALGVLGWRFRLASTDGSEVDYFARTLRGGLLGVDVATMAVIGAVTHAGSTLRRLLSWGPLHWLGRRTLGWYLYHWPVLQIVRWRSPRGLTPAMIALALAITAILAEISFQLVERPIRAGRLGEWARGERRPRTDLARRRRRAAVGLGSLAVLGAATAAVAIGVGGRRCPGGCDDRFALVTSPASPTAPTPSGGATTPTVADTSAAGSAPSSSVSASAVTASVVAPVDTTGGGSQPTPASELAGISVPIPGGGTAMTEVPSSTPGAGSRPLGTAPAPATTSAPTTIAATTAPPTTVHLPDTRSNEPIAIGDSVMADAQRYLTPGLWVSARAPRVPADVRIALEGAVRRHGWAPTVIVHVGNNGPIRQRELDRMVASMPPDEVKDIYFVTVLGPGAWIEENNRLLAGMVGKDPRIHLIDWANDPSAPAIEDVAGPVRLDEESAQAYAAVLFGALARPDLVPSSIPG